MSISSICDKCGLPGERKQDAVRLHVEAFPDTALLLFAAQGRHILPIVKDGEVVCEGSPSRAQYLEGQARSEKYPYIEEDEARWRSAYEVLQAG